MNPEQLTQCAEDERLAAFQQAFDLDANRSIPTRLRLLEFARNGYQGQVPAVRTTDRWLVERMVELAREIRAVQAELRGTIETLTAPPHIPAVYLDSLNGRALVSIEGRGQRVVGLGELNPEDLQPGDEVSLSNELNVIVEKIPSRNNGHIGRFERSAKGQAVVRHRGEEVLCSTVNGLVVDDLRPGDSVRIDPANRLAFEKIEDHPTRLPFEIEDLPELHRHDIAGLDSEVEQVLGNLAINLNGSLAERFRLDGGLTSILLHGFPGTGKTLLARVAASELRRTSGRNVRWIHLKPSIWKSKYVGETESAIRETFRAIQRVSSSAGNRQHVVVFMDEAETFGRRRGTSGTHSYIDDFTNVLLAELDGFTSLNNVSLISATNRKDLIDPALRERIGGIDVAVPRPKLAAAKAILEVHLEPGDPWAAEHTRAEAIEAAAALIFMGESNRICKIVFNDSSTRTIQARELVSGRVLASIATNARRLAARRAAGSPRKAQGMEVNDVIEATEAAMDSLRTCLTRENAHSYLGDLKQDLAVVAVEPIYPKPSRPHSYLNPVTP